MQILGEYYFVRWFDVAMEVLWMGFCTVFLRHPTGSLYLFYGYFMRRWGFEEVSMIGFCTVLI